MLVPSMSMTSWSQHENWTPCSRGSAPPPRHAGRREGRLELPHGNPGWLERPCEEKSASLPLPSLYAATVIRLRADPGDPTVFLLPPSHDARRVGRQPPLGNESRDEVAKPRIPGGRRSRDVAELELPHARRIATFGGVVPGGGGVAGGATVNDTLIWAMLLCAAAPRST